MEQRHIHVKETTGHFTAGKEPVRITESLRDWNNAEFTLASAVFYLPKSPSSAHWRLMWHRVTPQHSLMKLFCEKEGEGNVLFFKGHALFPPNSHLLEEIICILFSSTSSLSLGTPQEQHMQNTWGLLGFLLPPDKMVAALNGGVKGNEIIWFTFLYIATSIYETVDY